MFLKYHQPNTKQGWHNSWQQCNEAEWYGQSEIYYRCSYLTGIFTKPKSKFQVTQEN